MHIYIDTDIAVVSSMQHYFPVWFNPPPTGTCAVVAQVMRQRGVEPTIATGEKLGVDVLDGAIVQYI